MEMLYRDELKMKGERKNLLEMNPEHLLPLHGFVLFEHVQKIKNKCITLRWINYFQAISMEVKVLI